MQCITATNYIHQSRHMYVVHKHCTVRLSVTEDMTMRCKMMPTISNGRFLNIDQMQRVLHF